MWNWKCHNTYQFSQTGSQIQNSIYEWSKAKWSYSSGQKSSRSVCVLYLLAFKHKCVTLQCYWTINPHLTNYLVENYTLKNVNQHLYLGVMLDKTMSFTTHINTTISRTSKMLNFVKRNLSSCLRSIKEKAYLSLVCPTLEYASSVWDPYQTVHITNIEKIQKRAACFMIIADTAV